VSDAVVARRAANGPLAFVATAAPDPLREPVKTCPGSRDGTPLTTYIFTVAVAEPPSVSVAVTVTTLGTPGALGVVGKPSGLNVPLLFRIMPAGRPVAVNRIARVPADA